MPEIEQRDFLAQQQSGSDFVGRDGGDGHRGGNGGRGQRGVAFHSAVARPYAET